jgi:starvation-inducible DNA-binding protein
MATMTRSRTALHPTKNDLPEPARSALIEILNQRLADAIDLQLQSKQAHWNVKGPSFIALHELFDKVVDHAAGAADLVAERVVQLGGVAEGTARTVAQRSELEEYPLDIATGPEHVAALSDALAAFGTRVRQAIEETAKLDDAATADIFTEIARGTDKLLWFVEAHAQASA